MRKNLLRQRLYWARLRTMLRNRIHALLDRQRSLELPQCSDIFGVRGLSFLRRLELPETDATLLCEQLALHDLIAQQMKAQEKRIGLEFGSEAMHRQLLSVPGIGPTPGRSHRVRSGFDRALFHRGKTVRLRRSGPHYSFQRRQDKAWATPALLQQVVALGFDRSKLGSDRMLTVLWCTLQTT